MLTGAAALSGSQKKRKKEGKKRGEKEGKKGERKRGKRRLSGSFSDFSSAVEGGPGACPRKNPSTNI